MTTPLPPLNIQGFAYQNLVGREEEIGTWTPQIRFGGAMVGWTVNSEGHYSRVGRSITATFYLQIAIVGASVGTAAVHNIPYGIYSFATTNYQPTGALDWRLLAGNIGSAFIKGNITNQCFDIMGQAVAGPTAIQLTDVMFVVGSILHGTITYIKA